MRDVGKAMGFPEEEIGRLAKRIPSFTHADGIEGAIERYPELRNSGIPFAAEPKAAAGADQIQPDGQGQCCDRGQNHVAYGSNLHARYGFW